MANETLPLLLAQNPAVAVLAADIMIIRQGAQANDGAVTAAQLATFVKSTVDTITVSTGGSGSPHVLLQSENGIVFTNTGAGALAYFTLPTTPSIGTTYSFYVDASVGIHIVAPASATVRIAAAVSAAAGFAESLTIGNAVKLDYLKANTWVATSVVGSWTVT